MGTILTVGRFTYDPATNQVAGPSAFMTDMGSKKLDAIANGTDAGFNAMVACAPSGSDPATLVLVALQTAYAGWLGQKEIESLVGRR